MASLRQLLKQARVAITEEDYEKAISVYEEILSLNGMSKDLDTQLRLAWCHEQIEQIDDALGFYHQVIQQYEELNEKQAADQLREIVTKLEYAANHDAEISGEDKPKPAYELADKDQLLLIARQASENGAYEEAADIYKEILNRDGMSGNIEIQIKLAWCHEKSGKVDSASHLYHDVIQRYDNVDEEEAAQQLKSIVDSLNRSAQPIFQRSPDPISETELIEHLMQMGDQIHLQPKEVLCEAGGPPDTLWLLCKGVLRFKMKGYDDEPDIAYTDEKGVMLVGELGVFTQQPRSATVWSEKHADLYAISASDIRKRRASDPEFDAAMDRLIREKWVSPIISRHALFDRVNEIHRKQIIKKFTPVELKAGDCLVDLGEVHNACYLIQIGCMFFLDTAQDNRTQPTQLLANALPSDLIHTGGLMKDFKSPCRIAAATNVRLLRLSQEDFEPFTHQRPWLIQALVRQSRRPSHLQILHPDDDYLWTTNRHIELHRVGTSK